MEVQENKIINMKNKNHMIVCPIWEKINLTIEEAAIYSNIGINRINDMAKQPNCPFVLYIGRKKLIKRKEFEKYFEKVIEL